MTFKKMAATVCSCLAAVALVGCLAGCSSTTTTKANADNNTVKLGVLNDYHKDVVEAATDVYAAYGLTVDIVTYDDAESALDDLKDNKLDAAYVTNVFRLNEYNAENDSDLTDQGSVTYGRLGAYSKKYTSLDELPEGATVAIADSDQEYSRGLNFLATNKLLTLDSTSGTVLATKDAAITANTKNLQFTRVAYDKLVSALDTYDLVLIPYDDAIAGGLTFDQAIASETANSTYGGYFSDIVADTNANDSTYKMNTLIKCLMDSEATQAITDLFPSKEVVIAGVEQDYRTDKYAYEEY